MRRTPSVVAAAIAAALSCGARAGVTLDMPAPPAGSGAAGGEADLGRIALARYAGARSAPTSTWFVPSPQWPYRWYGYYPYPYAYPLYWSYAYPFYGPFFCRPFIWPCR